jgi:hypothetical protein
MASGQVARRELIENASEQAFGCISSEQASGDRNRQKWRSLGWGHGFNCHHAVMVRHPASRQPRSPQRTRRGNPVV